MKRLAFLMTLASICGAISVEETAAQALVIRGTVLDRSTEGKDVPIPKIEPGASPLLETTWKVRIDECHFSARGDCREEVGNVIELTDVTGVAIERAGGVAYEELVTNSGAHGRTAALHTGGTFLLAMQPSESSPASFRILPVEGACQTLSTDAAEIELLDRVRKLAYDAGREGRP